MGKRIRRAVAMVQGVGSDATQWAVSYAIADLLSYLDPYKQTTPQGDEYLIINGKQAVLVTVRDFPIDMAHRIAGRETDVSA